MVIGNRIWLIASAVAVVAIAAVIGEFLWKNSRPLPSVIQVESQFEKEIRALAELTGQIDLEELLYRPHQAFPPAKVNETREQLSGSSLLSASVNFSHPGSRNTFSVAHDDSLNLWSLTSSPEKEGSYLAFCYSGGRQLIRYERINVADSAQTVGFEIVFAPEALEVGD